MPLLDGHVLLPVASAEPSHSASKPIDHSSEIRLTERRPNWLKDVGRHTLEVDVGGSALGAELFEGAAYLACHIVQFSCPNLAATGSTIRSASFAISPFISNPSLITLPSSGVPVVAILA